ncbi:hypothetical protein N431DRAFT_481499 [Stipitochalara longipes BDJ]|nr:hypothetical protein N431DRAFT_481499 [Stipitochalara longipes BDJ]
MRVICPLSACCSYEKRDQFLALLRDIAVVTKESEPRTISYGWFQSAKDNPEVPNYYVRGFEVYEDESALAEVHRMSGPYKNMRATVGPYQILERPTDLRFLQPTGIGFMARGSMDLFDNDDHLNEDDRSLVVVQEIRPKQGSKQELLKYFEILASHARKSSEGVACFWVLEYLEEYLEDGVVVFSRFDTDAEYQKHVDCSEMKQIRDKINENTDSMRTTKWSLTYGKDKLVALAGVIEKIEKKRKDKGLAGIWKSGFEQGLLWWVRAGTAIEVQEYRAPSWS